MARGERVGARDKIGVDWLEPTRSSAVVTERCNALGDSLVDDEGTGGGCKPDRDDCERGGTAGGVETGGREEGIGGGVRAGIRGEGGGNDAGADLGGAEGGVSTEAGGGAGATSEGGRESAESDGGRLGAGSVGGVSETGAEDAGMTATDGGEAAGLRAVRARVTSARRSESSGWLPAGRFNISVRITGRDGERGGTVCPDVRRDV